MRSSFARACRITASILIGTLSLASQSFAQTTTVRLAWTPSADAAQIAVALDKQLWKSKNVEVTTVSFPTGREALEALIGGQVDFAAIAEFPAAIAALRNQRFGVIADLSRYTGNRIVTTDDITSITGLAGKKVGATVGTNTQYQTETALAAAKVSATIVNVAPPDLLSALVRKDIDAAAVFPAFVGRAKQMLGQKYNELPTPSYVTHFLIAASDEVLNNHPDSVKAFLSGLIAADAIVRGDVAATQQSIVKATGGAQKLDSIAQLWPDYEFGVVLQESLAVLMADEAKWILGKGLIKNDKATPDIVRSFIRPDFLKQVAADRVTLK